MAEGIDIVRRIGVTLGVLGMIAVVIVALSACSPVFIPGGSLVLDVFD